MTLPDLACVVVGVSCIYWRRRIAFWLVQKGAIGNEKKFRLIMLTAGITMLVLTAKGMIERRLMQ